jgi:hypothetical protein
MSATHYLMIKYFGSYDKCLEVDKYVRRALGDALVGYREAFIDREDMDSMYIEINYEDEV